MNHATLPLDNLIHGDLGRTYYKANASEKIKKIDNKIEQTKSLYDLDKQTAKNSALSSGNVSKYELLTGEDVLSEKGPLENAATIKKFEYSPSDSELKRQTDITKSNTNDYSRFKNLT